MAPSANSLLSSVRSALTSKSGAHEIGTPKRKHRLGDNNGRIRLHEMISSEHCLARAERLRMLMLRASDPAAAIRLRRFVKIYKDLAERAKKDAGLAPAAKQIDHTEASAPPRSDAQGI
jgi:hypothetical protein